MEPIGSCFLNGFEVLHTLHVWWLSAISHNSSHPVGESVRELPALLCCLLVNTQSLFNLCLLLNNHTLLYLTPTTHYSTSLQPHTTPPHSSHTLLHLTPATHYSTSLQPHTTPPHSSHTLLLKVLLVWICIHTK